MKTYLIDLDGTMYHGNTINPNANELIDYFYQNNIPFYFFTNNATRTGLQNVEHMNKVGILNTKPEQFFTSSIAACMYISQLGKGKNAYYIGQDGLKEALINYGFNICEQDVDYVFVGLDVNANYEDYSKALNFLLNGAKLVGTNIDRKIPRSDSYAIGNGAVVDMFEYASNQKSIPLGKPFKSYLDMALKFVGKKSDEVIIVGDNLETDIKCGLDNQVESIFYTGGVHTREDIKRLNINPDSIIDDLSELIK